MPRGGRQVRSAAGLPAAAVCLLLLLTPHDNDAIARTQTGIVAGVVVAADSGQPLPRATVSLTNLADPTPSVTLADNAGRFRFDEVAAGSYRVMATRAGYVPTAYGARRYDDPGITIVVSSDSRFDDLRVALMPGAAVSGDVVDVNGRPASAVTVTALRVIDRPGDARSLAPVPSLTEAGVLASTRTDGHGHFRLYGLPADRYAIQARWMKTGGATPAAMFTGYYPGVVSRGEAVPVELAAGSERAIRLMLTEPAVTALRGIVMDGGAPAGGVRVAIDQEGPDAGFLESVTSDASGRFVFESVPAGRYTVEARTTTDHTGWGRTAAVVDGAQPTDVVLPLEPGLSLAGQIEFDDLPAEQRQAAALVRLIPQYPWQREAALALRPDAAGRFGLRDVVPGRYRVTATAGAGAGAEWSWTVEAVRVGEHERAGDLLVIPASVSDLRAIIILTTPNLTLSGTVRDAEGHAATGVAILAFPVDPDSRITTRIRTARPRTDATFDLSGLLPGDFFVAAARDADPATIVDRGFLERVAPLPVRPGGGSGRSWPSCARATPNCSYCTAKGCRTRNWPPRCV